jgi:hypothetical protein
MLTHGPDPLMLAYAAASAIFAEITIFSMLTYAAAFAIFAEIFDSSMLANAAS